MSVKKCIAEKFYVPSVRGIKSVFKNLKFFQNTCRLRVLLELQNAFSSILRLLLSFKDFIVLAIPSASPSVKIFSPRKNAYHQPLAISLMLSDSVSQGCAGQR